MPHKTKAIGRKIRKIAKDRPGLSQKARVGRAFGILRGRHKRK